MVINKNILLQNFSKWMKKKEKLNKNGKKVAIKSENAFDIFDYKQFDMSLIFGNFNPFFFCLK